METVHAVLGGVSAAAAIAVLAGRCRAYRKQLEECQATAAEQQQRLRSDGAAATENFQAILASMAEGVMVVDHQRTIRLTNPSLRKMFSLKCDPAGQTVLSALRLPILETMIRAAIADGAPQQEETSVQLVPGQAPTHLIVSTLPLKNGGKEPPGAVTVIQNISRLRNLEEVRREFVANVSHELRTPLAIFHGYLENLLDRPNLPEDELVSVLRIMQKHSTRLNALVEDLLTLTRLESRRDPLMREKSNLGEYLHQVAMDWEPRCAQKEVQLVTEVGEDVPPLLLDPLRFRQVLDNLLDNALKYSPAGGRITLSAHLDTNDGHVTIRVADVGSGIPPGDLPHIFERFYRADRARSRELGGTGLGLSIVKHIMQAHGGQVAAESQLGRGTTILLILPAPTASLPSAAAA